MQTQTLNANLGVAVSRKVLVIGVGNEYRHDDAAGLIVARQLKAHTHPLWQVHEQSGEATALMQLWGDAECVIVIDAVQSGAPPGTVHTFDATPQSLPARMFRGSSHLFGLTQAIELSRMLRQLPPKFIVYGIEGEKFEPGIGISISVLNGIMGLVEIIRPAVHNTVLMSSIVP